MSLSVELCARRVSSPEARRTVWTIWLLIGPVGELERRLNVRHSTSDFDPADWFLGWGRRIEPRRFRHWNDRSVTRPISLAERSAQIR
jgi:hypothetical protein